MQDKDSLSFFTRRRGVEFFLIGRMSRAHPPCFILSCYRWLFAVLRGQKKADTFYNVSASFMSNPKIFLYQPIDLSFSCFQQLFPSQQVNRLTVFFSSIKLKNFAPIYNMSRNTEIATEPSSIRSGDVANPASTRMFIMIYIRTANGQQDVFFWEQQSVVISPPFLRCNCFFQTGCSSSCWFFVNNPSW